MRVSVLGAIAALSIVGSSACNREAPVPGPVALVASPDARPPAPGDAAVPSAVPGTRDADAEAPPPPSAVTHEVTIPAGTRLAIVLDDTVASDTSRPEQPVRAHLSQAVAIHDETVLRPGSRLTGVVTDATRSAKVKGRAHVALRFTTIGPAGDGERYTLRADPISRTAPATKEDDALKIGVPAAGGAVIGGLLGGKKGALIGGAAGGGGGTAVVLTTRGKEVRLPKGTALSLRLAEPLTIRVGR
jgi:hypothetical protein